MQTNNIRNNLKKKKQNQAHNPYYSNSGEQLHIAHSAGDKHDAIIYDKLHIIFHIGVPSALILANDPINGLSLSHEY